MFKKKKKQAVVKAQPAPKKKVPKKKNPTSFGKSLLVFLGCLILGIMLAGGFMLGPRLQKNTVIAHSKVSSTYSPREFEGWVYADIALHREQRILYDHNPNNSTSRRLEKQQDYPKLWLPDVIDEYGIAVQKPYTGTYVFNTEKQQLLSFYNNEADLLLKAEAEYKPMYGKPTANDAEVIQALNQYIKLIDKLATATSKVTLQQAREYPIGYYIQRSIGKNDLSQPLGYGAIATKYLDTNISNYEDTYNQYLNNGDTDTTRPEVEYVQKMLNLGNND